MGADPGSGAVLASYVQGALASTAAATGGWCVLLGKPAGSVLTTEDAGKIATTAFQAIDNGAGVQALNPLWWPIANGAKQAIAKRLQEWLAEGATCSDIPNDLSKDPEIDRSIIDNPGEAVGSAINIALDLSGLGVLLGDLGPRLLFLGGVLVLLVIGIRRVLD